MSIFYMSFKIEKYRIFMDDFKENSFMKRNFQFLCWITNKYPIYADYFQKLKLVQYIITLRIIIRN